MTEQEKPAGFQSGFVSLIGRPNVGKSTLLNLLLGQKIAIISPKPQTTRNRILGIKNLPAGQIIFLDTPGIHRSGNLLNQSMVRTALATLQEVDVDLSPHRGQLSRTTRRTTGSWKTYRRCGNPSSW